MRSFVKLLLIVLSFSVSMSVFALSKEEVKKSLEQMREAGMFTEEQIKAAEKELMGMSQDDLDAIEKKGIEHAKDPKIQAQAQKIMQGMQQKKTGN